MKRSLFVVFLLAVFLTTGIVLADTPKRGGSLVVCQPAEPPGLDPTGNTAAAIDRVVFSNIYEGLIKVNSDGEFVPGLAVTWMVSADGLTYTFHLRHGVKFHNGEVFNAATAKWNLERAMGEKTRQSPSRILPRDR